MPGALMRKLFLVFLYVFLVLPITFMVSTRVIMIPSMLLAATAGPIAERPIWIQGLTGLNILLAIAGAGWLSWKAWRILTRDMEEPLVSCE